MPFEKSLTLLFVMLKKDSKIIFRNPKGVILIILFLLLSIILLHYSLISWIDITSKIAWGEFWIIFLFSSLFGIIAVNEIDQENDNATGIRMSLVTPTIIYIERIILFFTMLLFIALLCLIMFSFFFSTKMLNVSILLSISTVIFGIACQSSLISFLLQPKKINEILFYILFFSLSLPQFLLGIQVIQNLIALPQTSIFFFLSSALSFLYFFLGIFFINLLKE